MLSARPPRNSRGRRVNPPVGNHRGGGPPESTIRGEILGTFLFEIVKRRQLFSRFAQKALKGGIIVRVLKTNPNLHSGLNLVFSALLPQMARSNRSIEGTCTVGMKHKWAGETLVVARRGSGRKVLVRYKVSRRILLVDSQKNPDVQQRNMLVTKKCSPGQPNKFPHTRPERFELVNEKEKENCTTLCTVYKKVNYSANFLHHPGRSGPVGRSIFLRNFSTLLSARSRSREARQEAFEPELGG
jgi:hypothetical protein